jgi:hypothetical protein
MIVISSVRRRKERQFLRLLDDRLIAITVPFDYIGIFGRGYLRWRGNERCCNADLPVLAALEFESLTFGW